MTTQRQRDARRAAEKNQPLVEDIRLLGRLLGETIRGHEGEATFDRSRKSASSRWRAAAWSAIAAAGRALAQVLDGLTTQQTVLVVRAFSYFSLLANIAEDRHHVRRHREHRRAGMAPLASTARGRRGRCARAGIEHRASWWRASAPSACSRCSPRIRPRCSARASSTASVAIADGLARLDSADALPEDIERATLTLRRLIATLWQTRILRTVRLGVRDEIENVLSYFHYTFIDVLPAMTADLEDALAAGVENGASAPTCRRSSPWARGSAATATAIRS